MGCCLSPFAQSTQRVVHLDFAEDIGKAIIPVDKGSFAAEQTTGAACVWVAGKLTMYKLYPEKGTLLTRHVKTQQTVNLVNHHAGVLGTVPEPTMVRTGMTYNGCERRVEIETADQRTQSQRTSIFGNLSGEMCCAGDITELTEQLTAELSDDRSISVGAARLTFNFECPHGKVEGHPQGQDKLLEALNGLVPAEALQTIEDAGVDFARFAEILRVQEQFKELIPRHADRAAVLEHFKRFMSEHTSSAQGLMQEYVSLLQTHGSTYEYDSVRYARVGRKGERVVYAVDGEMKLDKVITDTETWVMFNPHDRSTYTMSDAEFKASTGDSPVEDVEEAGLQAKGFRKYKYTKKIIAMQVNSSNVGLLVQQDWESVSRGKQEVQIQDWVVTALPMCNDVYAMAPSAFAQNLRISSQGLLEILQADGTSYKAESVRYARRALREERVVFSTTGERQIDTVVDDETTWVLMNPSNRSIYIMDDVSFMACTSHRPSEELTDEPSLVRKGFKKFSYKKQVLALQLDEAALRKLPCCEWKSTSRGKQRVNIGDWIVGASPEYKDVYGMTDPDFHKMYDSLDMPMTRVNGTRYARRAVCGESHCRQFCGVFASHAKQQRQGQFSRSHAKQQRRGIDRGAKLTDEGISQVNVPEERHGM